MSWGGLLSVIAAATLVAGCEMGRASTSGRADLQVALEIRTVHHPLSGQRQVLDFEHCAEVQQKLS